jgi:hypothetical protein
MFLPLKEKFIFQYKDGTQSPIVEFSIQGLIAFLFVFREEIIAAFIIKLKHGSTN